MLINHSADKFICVAFRDEPYHGAGDYNVPYSGVPTHNTWSHPDVQQLQASQQQDARQQRCKLKSSKTQYTNHLSLAWGPPCYIIHHIFLSCFSWKPELKQNCFWNKCHICFQCKDEVYLVVVCGKWALVFIYHS